MRRLKLREHDTHEDQDLTEDQARRLQALVPDLTVTPSRSGLGFDIETGSHVGAIRIGELAVEIRAKIAIRRVLFLLAYSLTPGTWRDTEFPYRSHWDMVDCLAFGFVRFCRRAISRGLICGYRERTEALQGVRGRIRFDAQVKNRFGRAPPVEVEYDEFTEDLAENRILFAAVEALGRLHLRSKELNASLRSLRPAFGNVTLMDFRRRSLPEITFNRLNEHYRPAVRLARLILGGTSVRHRTGEITNASFLVDMNQLFEDFVVVALREVLGLTERSFPQEARGRSLTLDEARRVSLEPDLSWWRGGQCVFVGDVKYKRTKRSGAQNPDLYQMLAYMVATDLPSGMLVYAEGEAERASHLVRRLGREVRVRTLDLTKRRGQILEDIEGLADEIRGSVPGSTLN